MSGETEEQVSGWTVDTLKEHFYALRADDKVALAAALASAEKASDKAEKAQQGINKTQNEFRGTLKDQAVTLMPIKEAEGKFDDLQKQLNELKSGSDNYQGRSTQKDLTLTKFGIIVGAVVSIVGILITIAVLAFNN